MKHILKLIWAVLFIPVVALAQDEISLGQVIGNGRLLGAKTFDGQTIVGVLGIDSSGNTVIKSLSGKSTTLPGTLSVTGAATFSSTVSSAGLQFPTANEEAVAGAGTTVSDAAALSATKHIHQLTGANGTVGWKFATSVANQFEFLLNTTAGVPKIYAASGGTCNGGSANAACTLVTGIVSHICYSTAADTWICA